MVLMLIPRPCGVRAVLWAAGGVKKVGKHAVLLGNWVGGQPRKGDTQVKGTCVLCGLADPPQSNCGSVWWPVLMLVTGGPTLDS